MDAGTKMELSGPANRLEQMRKAEGVGVGQGLVWEEESQSREATCSPTPEHWHWDCWPGSCTERKSLQIPCRLQLLITLVKEVHPQVTCGLNRVVLGVRKIPKGKARLCQSPFIL